MEDKANWWLQKHRDKPTFMALCNNCREMREITSEEYMQWWREKRLNCMKCGKDITEKPRIMI